MPPFASINEGALKLFGEVNRLFPNNEKFHIVAKSMGGLSTRLMLHQHSMADRVMSVTTISTPHRGSEVADFYAEGGKCTLASEVILPVAEKMGEILGIGDDGLKQAGEDLRPKNMKKFNDKVKDDPKIPVFSFSYQIDCKDQLCDLGPMPFYPTNPLSACWHNVILRSGGGENDGLVSIKSAEWGTPLGPYEGEHLAETSKPNEYFPMVPLYKGKQIWKDVFQRVIDNLNLHKLPH